jgi:hypothetical protein
MDWAFLIHDHELAFHMGTLEDCSYQLSGRAMVESDKIGTIGIQDLDSTGLGAEQLKLGDLVCLRWESVAFHHTLGPAHAVLICDSNLTRFGGDRLAVRFRFWWGAPAIHGGCDHDACDTLVSLMGSSPDGQFAVARWGFGLGRSFTKRTMGPRFFVVNVYSGVVSIGDRLDRSN